MKQIRLVWLVALCAAGAVQAQQVKAPPLPPGSALVKPDPGLNPDEGKRSVRAHHHKGHVKKDYTRDDSMPGNNGNGNGNGNGNNGNGNGNGNGGKK